MGYVLHSADTLTPPLWLVQEQVVTIPAGGFHSVVNTSRKLLLVIGGECRHVVQNHREPAADVMLRAGDCLAIPHRCEQRYFPIVSERETRLHVVRIALDPKVLPLLAPDNRAACDDTSDSGECPGTLTALADSALRRLRYVAARDAVSLSETLRQLTDELANQEPGRRLRIEALCTSLLILFARLAGNKVAPSTDPDTQPIGAFLVAQTKVLLRERLSDSVTLSQLAASVGVSDEHLARRFKSTTGETVFGYLRRLRIERAKHFLATSEMNLSEIARRTGFSSPTLFSRTFRGESGVSPSTFRKRVVREVG